MSASDVLWIDYRAPCPSCCIAASAIRRHYLGKQRGMPRCATPCRRVWPASCGQKGKTDVLYKAYEIQRSLMNASSAWASMMADVLNDPRLPFATYGPNQTLASALDVFAHATAPRGKPAFGIRTVQVDGQTHAVHETTVVHRPFGDLKRFTHDGLGADAPRLLLVAPMSGHYATLLRGTWSACWSGPKSISPTGPTRSMCRWPKGISTSMTTSTI
jgi:hypothetical protein